MPENVVAPDTLTLLTLVPELVGFEPTSSLVLVTFHSGRSGGALRVDLPPNADEVDGGSAEELRRFAATLIGLACKVRGADALLVVTYSDDSCAEGPPAVGLVRQLRRAATDAGFPVLGAHYVAVDGWGDYDEAGNGDRATLDAAVRRRRDRNGAASIGRAPREEAELPSVDTAEVTRTAEALAAFSESREPPDPVWFAEYSAGWRGDDNGPITAGLTAHLLAVPRNRDVVLLTWAWGTSVGERALRFQERSERGEPVDDDDIAVALAGRAALPRPSTPRVERVIRLLRDVAARLPSQHRAPVLTSLAWLNWALGRGSIAGVHIEAALASDPGYSFARLVDAMLNAGTLPEWVFRQPDERSRVRRAAGGAWRG